MGFDEPRSLGEQASGSALALPIWIGFMDKALAGVPEATPVVPDGLVRVGDDWRYAEWAQGGQVARIGIDAAPAAASAPLAEPAASAVSAAATAP